jgi:Protein of unknown function (DUF3307)
MGRLKWWNHDQERVMIWQFLILLAVHWVADFVLQTHWQASNKSKNWQALSAHVMGYSVVLMFVSIYMFGAVGLLFAGVNGVLHFATDAVTSRITARLYAKQDWHNFFVVVGLDQLIHQVTLGVTLWAVLQ